ncbi:MAG: hypothetical protein AAGI52_17025 [Bacteroidota bacterium]
MITRESLSLSIVGDTFSPGEASRQTGLQWNRANEPGEIGARGRYKGRPTPFGSARLEVADESPEEDKLTPLLRQVVPHMETLRSLDAETFEVYVGYVWRDQCNLAFSPSAMRLMGEHGIMFWVSCYEDDASLCERSAPRRRKARRRLSRG